MTPQEANRTIARFMEHQNGHGFGNLKNCFRRAIFCHEHKGIRVIATRYDQDLEALLSVWEKLEPMQSFFTDICRSLTNKGRWDFNISCYTGTMRFSGEGETLQEAAAIATAKAILGLRGKEIERSIN